MFCPQCGTRMPDHANFCINCGENLAKYKSPSGFVEELGGDGPADAATARVVVPPVAAAAMGASDVPGVLAAARMAAEGGRLPEAADLFQKAAMADPHAKDAWYGLGITYGRMGRHLDALSAFNRLIEAKPRLAEAWDGKAMALMELGRTGEAVAAYNEALYFDPDFHSARIEKGLALMRLEDLRGALACFDELLARDPGHGGAYIHRADVLVRLGDREEAMRSYDRALEIDNTNGSGWRRKGELLLVMEHPADALKCFEHALNLDTNDFEALLRVGDAKRQVGDPAGAIAAYETARKMRADSPDPWAKIGMIQFSLGKYEASRDAFIAANRIAPEHQVAAVNLAVAYYRCGQLPEAKKAAEAAMQRWPRQSELTRLMSVLDRKMRPSVGPITGRTMQPPSVQHTVEDIFVIYRDGRLMSHQTRRLRADMDNQLLSGMLTAIQSFIQEAFKEGEEGQLNEMAFGRNLILLERGQFISLAVVIKGVPPVGARAELQFALHKIEQTYAKVLDGWAGDSAGLRGMGDVTKRLLEVI